MQNKTNRVNFIRGVALAIVLFASVMGVRAQGGGGGGGQGAPQPLMVHQLKPNVYWVEGAGGNSGVIVGNNGVIVIDTKTSPAAGAELVADVAKITPKPITDVIVTHSDGDHVNGLPSFPARATIIATQNCYYEMLAASKTPQGAILVGHLPTRMVTTNMEDTTIEGVHLRFLHLAPAHTTGDLMIYLPDDQIMFTGDMVAMQSPYPFIHLEKNGSYDGWLASMNYMLAVPDATIFLPGHGAAPLTRADMQKRIADTMARREQIRALVVDKHMNLDQVRQALGEAPPRAGGPPSAYPNFSDFTAVSVVELTPPPPRRGGAAAAAN